VSVVFDHPLEAFLTATATAGEEKWYDGAWIGWFGERWRMHQFYVPARQPPPSHHKVWGMTSRILVDVARIAYGRPPDFDHLTGFGDEDLMRRLAREGLMGADADELGDGVDEDEQEEGEEERAEEEEVVDSVRRTGTSAKI
ncbi:hypothetical protein GP486_008918, partial [Trichoglossum hirsutum]